MRVVLICYLVYFLLYIIIYYIKPNTDKCVCCRVGMSVVASPHAAYAEQRTRNWKGAN